MVLLARAGGGSTLHTAPAVQCAKYKAAAGVAEHERQGRAGEEGRAGEGRGGLGRAGQGRAGQSGARQGWAGVWSLDMDCPDTCRPKGQKVWACTDKVMGLACSAGCGGSPSWGCDPSPPSPAHAGRRAVMSCQLGLPATGLTRLTDWKIGHFPPSGILSYPTHPAARGPHPDHPDHPARPAPYRPVPRVIPLD